MEPDYTVKITMMIMRTDDKRGNVLIPPLFPLSRFSPLTVASETR